VRLRTEKSIFRKTGNRLPDKDTAGWAERRPNKHGNMPSMGLAYIVLSSVRITFVAMAVSSI
jgi:hypothetical protein